MSQHSIRCRKTRKALAVKIGGGWCVCTDGQCSEESYDQHLRETTDFFTPNDKPPTDLRAPTKPNPVHITPEQIKYMADRFLAWKLPAGFRPDGGITFEPFGNKGTQYEYKREPSGTNLLDATQAYAMVQHMVAGGMPPGPVQLIDYPEQMLRDRDTIARLRKALREITNLPEVEGDQAPQIARAALDWEVRS